MSAATALRTPDEHGITPWERLERVAAGDALLTNPEATLIRDAILELEARAARRGELLDYLLPAPERCPACEGYEGAYHTFKGLCDAEALDEAITRARAAHVKADTFHQPGNDYRKEYRCTCGTFVFATAWEQHILDAADALRDGYRLVSNGLGAERVPL